MAEESKQAGKALPTGIAVELQRARSRAGLSHSELHRLTGISRTVLIGYEAGRTSPGAREIRKLCDALRVTANQLVYGTEQPFEPDEALKRLGLDVESIGFAHMMVLFNMLAVEDKRALITLMHSILEARQGRETMAVAAEAMKELEQFLPSVMDKMGFSREGLEKAFEPIAEEVAAEAERRFSRLAKQTKLTKKARGKAKKS